MSGVMGGAMKANILRIESMVSAYINGLMVEYMKVTGTQANNTAMENIRFEMEHIK